MIIQCKNLFQRKLYFSSYYILQRQFYHKFPQFAKYILILTKKGSFQFHQQIFRSQTDTKLCFYQQYNGILFTGQILHSQIGGQERKEDQQKNNRRKVKNKLIFLVGLHVLFIFGYAILMCSQYLVSQDWEDSIYLAVISDIIFVYYAIEILITIKFKNRTILITSIFTLVLAIGIKIGCLVVMIKSSLNVPISTQIQLGLLVANFVTPLGLIFLWNKLKQSKWRQTFDFQTKLNRHLSKQQEKSQAKI